MLDKNENLVQNLNIFMIPSYSSMNLHFLSLIKSDLTSGIKSIKKFQFDNAETFLYCIIKHKVIFGQVGQVSFGQDRLFLARVGQDRLGKARPGQVWIGLVTIGLVELGFVELGLVELGLVELG